MRHDHEFSLGVRLVVAATGAILLLVPVALIGIFVVGDADWLHRLDLNVTDALHTFALAHSGWVDVAAVCAVVFDPNVFRVGALLLVVWLVRRQARALALWVALTMTAGGLLAALLKLLVGRNRPDLLDPVARAAGYSFPSGHALNSALGAAVFLLVLLPFTRDRPVLRGALWTAAIVVPVLTGISRVLLGVHWTSDVVAGWLLGVAVVGVTAAVFLVWRGPRRGRVVREGLEPEVTEA